MKMRLLLGRYTAKSPDEDVAQIFVNNLESDIRAIYENTRFKKKVRMTEEDRTSHNSAIHCHICEDELGKDKVIDHCHLTGKYRGAAHRECNLKFKVPKYFPVIFHNLSGYDAHLFIKNLGATEGEVNCIPNNEEKYISFSKQIVVNKFTNDKGKLVEVKRELRFIDSLKIYAHQS